MIRIFVLLWESALAISTICCLATVSRLTVVFEEMFRCRDCISSSVIRFCCFLSIKGPFIGSRPTKMFSATVRSCIRFSS